MEVVGMEAVDMEVVGMEVVDMEVVDMEVVDIEMVGMEVAGMEVAPVTLQEGLACAGREPRRTTPPSASAPRIGRSCAYRTPWAVLWPQKTDRILPYTLPARRRGRQVLEELRSWVRSG
jgi:hypothetical protein